MSKKKEMIARIGLSAIGLVYVLIGILTALAALNLGGNQTGTKGAITFLADQPLGKILLLLLSFGLFGYVFWRMHQTFLDSRHLGTSYKALFTRAGYFSAGLFYGFWGFLSLKFFFNGGYREHQEVLIQILNSKYGSTYAVIFGLILVGKAVYEIYFVISDKFKSNVQSSGMKPNVKSVLLKFGVIGHFARGIVFGIMSFLTIRAGVTIRKEKVNTLTDAFQFLNYEFGHLVLSIVALGLLCFGLFMFVKSKYLYINMN